MLVIQTFNGTIAFTGLQIDPLTLSLDKTTFGSRSIIWYVVALVLASSDKTQNIWYWKWTFIEAYLMHMQEKERKLLNQQFCSVNAVPATAYGSLWTYNRSNTYIVTVHVTWPRVSCSQINENQVSEIRFIVGYCKVKTLKALLLQWRNRHLIICLHACTISLIKLLSKAYNSIFPL